MTKLNPLFSKSIYILLLVGFSLGAYFLGNHMRGFLPTAPSAISFDTQAFWDELNEGYVVVSRVFLNSTQVATKLYFLTDKDLPKEYISVGFSPIQGRGCLTPKIVSQKVGEVIFDTGGCFLLGETAASKDNLIFIIL